jgi:RNA polymerase sigma-B factor
MPYLAPRPMSADPNQRKRADNLPPPPGPEEGLAAESELLRSYAVTRDQAAREELVNRFLPFARSLAMRYSGGVEPSEDLIQVASLGLVSALERFDPERGVPFAAFAGPTILGELRRHFRDRVWTLRVPRGLQERIRDVDGAIAKLSHELERSPTVAELAELLEITEGDVLEAFEATVARRTVSLDAPSTGAEPGEEAPMTERIGTDDPGYELVEDRGAIDASADVLDDTEREVLRLRFAEDLTQSKIAERVGYSQMHVSRILRRALGKLRAAAGDRGAQI